MLIEPLYHNTHFDYEEIDNSNILYQANQLPLFGDLQCNLQEPYCFLKISDEFIYKLFTFLPKEKALQIPNYFTPPKTAGAHITVAYANEEKAKALQKNILSHKVTTTFYFEVERLIKLNYLQKTYYLLIVSAPMLTELRLQHGLKDKLNYHGLWVPFHITIATISKFTPST